MHSVKMNGKEVSIVSARPSLRDLLGLSTTWENYIGNGETLVLDHNACNGCGRCIDVCPHGVFVMVEKKAHIIAVRSCMECGACANNCETAAINVRAGVGCALAVIQGIIRGAAPWRVGRRSRSTRSTDRTGAMPPPAPRVSRLPE